ncbi:hypothetical protein YC2023_089519 [Brassica napus]
MFVTNEELEGLAGDKEDTVVEYLDAVIRKGAEVKLAANWIMSDIAAISINDVKLSPQELAELIAAIKDGTISGKIGKQEFDPEKCITDFLLMCDICCSLQITDPVEMEKMVMKVFSKSPKQLEQYRSGRTKLQGFFYWPGICRYDQPLT